MNWRITYEKARQQTVVDALNEAVAGAAHWRDPTDPRDLERLTSAIVNSQPIHDDPTRREFTTGDLEVSHLVYGLAQLGPVHRGATDDEDWAMEAGRKLSAALRRDAVQLLADLDGHDAARVDL